MLLNKQMELAREISRDLSRAIPAWRWGLVVVGVYMVAALAITYPLITTLSHGIPYEPAHDQLYQLSLLEFQTSSLILFNCWSEISMPLFLKDSNLIDTALSLIHI